MFDVGAPEFLLLLVIAIVLFGPEKLPDFARKTARMIRYLRTMAGNAQQQLNSELGPDFENLDVRDLNPRTFVQKHLLDEVEPIVADVKADFADVTTSEKPVTPGGPADAMAALTPGDSSAEPTSPARAATPFDPDAT